MFNQLNIMLCRQAPIRILKVPFLTGADSQGTPKCTGKKGTKGKVPFLTGADSQWTPKCTGKKGTKGKPRPSWDVAVNARLLLGDFLRWIRLQAGNIGVPSRAFSALHTGVLLRFGCPRRVLRLLFLLRVFLESVVSLFSLWNPEIRVPGIGIRPLVAMGTVDAYLRRVRTAPVGGSWSRAE
ncbi:hypothetical protein NDU88_001615 [Pleurodeles waltl]|uniref:Uncharacterized protein n=1 Tax=Pleurodeles waltl TaxID=8319 RepID=A0AAV7TKL6_PLEWA|nr:hypothetical protein NDU88_001615 [Pleurodeles waltl]